MAHYAKISNLEFTITERARLKEVTLEIDIIQLDNRASDEYIALRELYGTKNTSETLESLKSDLNALYNDLSSLPAQEDVDAIQASIQAEKDVLAAEAQDLLDQMKVLENQGTETLVAEKESLELAISNALCRVTKVLTGVDEIVMKPGDSTLLQEEVKVLEESKRDIDYTQDKEVWMAEVEAIQVQIQAKLEEIYAVPQVEFDNSAYWEGFYGGCKRTSYNTSGGVHKYGGTPFRKNYAAVGHIYDPVRDAFYAPQPYPSWTLNEDTCFWEPPVARPEGMDWHWKEDTTEWVDYVYINETGIAPYDSWTWDTNEGKWKAPVDYPEDGITYIWDEDTLSWEPQKPNPDWVWNEETLTWE